MLVNRVQPEFIGTNRIDPDYYRPEHLADEKHLRQFGSDELGTVGDFFAGPFGSKLPSDLYLSAGVPLFRVGNVGSMEVLLDGMAHLAPDVHEELIDSEVIPGDLLIVKASVGEKICRVPSWMPRANITQHIIGIRPNGHADMDYIAAFLFCQYGRRQLVRRSLGSIIQYLGVTDSKDVLFPRIKSTAQKHIGDKVRQAVRFRVSARTLEQQFADTICLQYPEVFGEPKTFGRSSRVASSSLRRDLNPGAFNPERLRVRAEIKRAGGRELAEVASIDASVTDSFGPDDDYIGLDSISSSTSQLAPVKVAMAEVEGASRVLREGPVISKLRPYLNKVGYIPTELARAVGSTELLCVRPNLGVSGWFIYGALKLSCTVRQFQPLANGSTLPRIDAEDVLEVMIPWHPEADRLGQDLERAQAMYFAAEKLTAAAKLLIEALIEGQVTETELVAAQEGLERGDDTADRCLLRRLTRQGIDVAGQPPLFPDLDALYTLLAQTKEAGQ